MDNIYTVWKDVYQKLEYVLAANVKDKEARKDLLHDVFLKIHANINTLKSQEKLLPWVHRITHNVIADHYRSGKKNVLVSEVPDTASTEQEYLNEKITGCIMPMIDRLDAKYREAIVLSELQGIKQKEIAENLNISFSGAKSRVQRGRKKLKEMILQCCEIEADIYGNVFNYTKKAACAENCHPQKK